MEKNTPDLPDVTESKTAPDFSQIIQNNPSGWILRADLTKKTGGLLHSRTAANLDSLGQGVPGRITMGRKVAYPAHAVVEFLERKFRVVANAE